MNPQKPLCSSCKAGNYQACLRMQYPSVICRNDFMALRVLRRAREVSEAYLRLRGIRDYHHAPHDVEPRTDVECPVPHATSQIQAMVQDLREEAYHDTIQGYEALKAEYGKAYWHFINHDEDVIA